MPLKEKLTSIKTEICSHTFWKAARCEFLATLLYVFIGCGSSVSRWKDGGINDLKVSLAFGLAQATLIQCVGHISGGHMNPAVTVAMFVTRNVTTARALCYILAQCLGALAGIGILYGITPVKNHHLLGLVYIRDGVDKGQAFGVEFMITFIFVFTFFANLEPKRQDMGSRSLSIGLSVTLGHLFALNYTGAGMNPARCLGPAIIKYHWTDHWLYWIGPLMGGIIGGFTYEYTHDSSTHLQYFKRSFRKKRKPASPLPETISVNSVATDNTFAVPSLDESNI